MGAPFRAHCGVSNQGFCPRLRDTHVHPGRLAWALLGRPVGTEGVQARGPANASLVDRFRNNMAIGLAQTF